jgi:hypothetical protein
MAVAHKILVLASHRLLEGTCSEEERYDRLQSRPEARPQKRVVKALERLGFRVTLERLASRRGASQLILYTPLTAPAWEPYVRGTGGGYLCDARDVVGSDTAGEVLAALGRCLGVEKVWWIAVEGYEASPDADRTHPL